MTNENNNPNYKEIMKMGKGEKFLFLVVVTVYSVKAILKLHEYLKDKKNFSNLKNLKDFKISTKYDVNSIVDISGDVLDMMYYIKESIQYFDEPNKVEVMKSNLEYMDEIFEDTERNLKRLSKGTKEIKCTKNDVIKFIKHSKGIETALHNYQYYDSIKAVEKYLKEYDKKKARNEEDEVFVKLLKKMKQYYSKVSGGITECAKISRVIERELKKIEVKK